jgi:peptide chain release factor 1
MEVKCQDGRSQGKNYEQAMRILRSRLFERQQERIHRERSDLRKAQVGTGERGAKVRTYHFKENRCTDHRIGLTLYNLDRVLEGLLDDVIDPLIAADRAAQLAGGQE